MTAHRESDDTMIAVAADMRLANARKYFEQTARAIANADDATIEALWLAHDSASRGLRTEALAEMRRQAGKLPVVTSTRRQMLPQGIRELIRRHGPIEPAAAISGGGLPLNRGCPHARAEALAELAKADGEDL